MPSARRTPSPTSSSFCSNPKSSTSTLSTTITTTTSDRSAPASGTMSDEADGVPPTIANNPATPPSPSPLTPPPLPTSTDSLELPSPPLPSTTIRTTSFPIREDCWSEDATHTLIEAWGAHYLELNRGNLRQKHWQEVADAVNAIHGHTKKLRRTDIQCKNRIDTLKKKYKVEKSKAWQSNGRYVSTWPFFASIDSLIGASFMKAKPPSPSPPLTRRNSMAANNTLALVPAPVRREFPALPPLPSVVPVGPRSKRPAPTASIGEESLFRRNFSAMAAAAAAVESVVEDEVCEDNSDTSSAVAAGMGRRKRKRASGKVAAEGYRKLAEAIGGFSEIYERVEEAKQRQIVELEKQRMQFAKDLEIQRMKLFMESQVHLKKLKRAKLNSQSDGYS